MYRSDWCHCIGTIVRVGATAAGTGADATMGIVNIGAIGVIACIAGEDNELIEAGRVDIIGGDCVDEDRANIGAAAGPRFGES